MEISPQNMALYGTLPDFRILKFPLISCLLTLDILVRSARCFYWNKTEVPRVSAPSCHWPPLQADKTSGW